MTEDIAATGIGYGKESVKYSSHSVRTEKPQLLHATTSGHEEHAEKTSTRMVITKVVSNKVTRKQLPFKMTVIPVYSLASLKTLALYIEGDSPYRISRSDRFPTSAFDIDESTQKEKRFRLFSNFSGSRYNLYEGEELLMTLVYESGLCRKYPFRQFQMYALAPGASYTSLFKKHDGQDLQLLYEFPDNRNKIIKMNNEVPNMDAEGEYKLKFSRRHVIPAVQNSVVVDETGEVCLQMVKLGENAFEVAWKGGVHREWGIALAIASLDFKWALQ